MQARTALVLLALLIAAPSLAADDAWRAKVHPSLLRSDEPVVEFLVVLERQADFDGVGRLRGKEPRTRYVVDRLREVAAASQPPLLERLARSGAEVRPFWIANTIWARGSREILETMARSSDVARIDANPRAVHTPPQTASIDRGGGAIEWNVALVGADQVWALGYDGSGIVIGSQDTGFFWEHPALIDSYRGWDGVSADHAYNWHDAIHSDAATPPTCLADSPEPCDDGFVFPHGTYTMGVSVGDDGGTMRTGVSPGARWIGCRNSDLGGGTPASYIECFQWLIAPTDAAGANPDPAMAPHVVNNSWACIPAEGCNPDTLQAIVETVRAAGIVVVAAAGNDGTECETVDYPPAIYDASLTVGATDIADAIGAISSRGPVTIDGSGRMKPDITAPGIDVTSSVGIWDIFTGDVDYSYFSADGTSAAAPHVAGAVALLLDARPDLVGDVDAIEALLTATALPLGSSQPCGGVTPGESPNHVFGHGRLDLVDLFTGDPDGDGVANVHDCAMDDATAWALADPIEDLRLGGAGTTSLAWSEPASVGADTFAYDVLRAGAANDLAAATCLVSGQAAPGASDASVPASAWFYVVRTVNACGGSAGPPSRDLPACP